jgi:hypothetical protein
VELLALTIVEVALGVETRKVGVFLPQKSVVVHVPELLLQGPVI